VPCSRPCPRKGAGLIVCVGADDDDGQKAVQNKPNATKEVMQKAKTAGATIEQIKTKYSVTAELEQYFINL
jgi:hypothetical protein